MLGLGAERVLELHRALHPGVVGGAVLTVGQLAVLPNLVVWAAAVLAGPGFALGSGTSVAPLAVTLGPLPAVPLLGALPAPGAPPTWALALLAVPVLAGAVAGMLLARRHPVPGPIPVRRLAVDVLGMAGVAGLALAVLSWLSGGPAGPGLLAVTGPDPLLTGAAFAAEVALGATLPVIMHFVRSRGNDVHDHGGAER
jgi:hypothetical protein